MELEKIARTGLLKISPQVGERGLVAWEIPVDVTDEKSSYGNVRYLVSPRNGRGEPQWVNAARIRFDGHVEA